MEKNRKSIIFKKRTYKEAFGDNDSSKIMKENPFIKTKNLQLTKIFSKINIQNEIKPNNGDNWSQIMEYIIAKILYKYNYHYEKYIELTKNKKK